MTFLSEFHFLRPYWFIALIPLAWIIWSLMKSHLINRNWEAVCDPALLPYILVGKTGARKYTATILTGMVTLLMIIALAGPVWERLPQPVFQKESALVIALDLSFSMYADDIKPNRLERARFKIADLLKLRQEGQTALLVYAGDAFTVSPLTNDIKTINSLLSALSPEIMPAPGSNTAIAIIKASALLKQAGVARGNILLVTDEVESEYQSAFEKAKKSGYTVSILGIGTEEGAPISLKGRGFLKDTSGAIVIPKLDSAALRNRVDEGGGLYVTSQIDDHDIERLNKLFTRDVAEEDQTKTEFESDQWHEFGPWLLLFVIPFAAFAFRREYLVIVLCVMLIQPDEVMALEWKELWLNKNQQAKQAFDQHQDAFAAELFQDEHWKAAAKYRSGDYAAVEELLNDKNDNRSFYNRANALAKQGKYEEAIAAYDRVLKNTPKHEDAKYNRDLVEKELKKQQQQQQSDSDQNSDEQQESDSEDEQEQQGQQKGEQSEQDQKQKSESESQQSEASEQDEMSEEKNLEQKAQEEKSEKVQEEKDKQQEQAEEESDEQEDAMQQEMTELDEEQQATEQWLRRIPDDPSGLLRRKFKYQYQKQNNKRSNNEKYW